MRRQETKLNMGGLLALLLFVVFAVCILSVLLTGADVYQNLSRRDRISYDRRTAAQYLTTRVRQSDAAGTVYTADFSDVVPAGEGDTLFLTEELEGEWYCTRIYCFDGYIRELFSELEGEFFPEDGEPVLEAQQLHFSQTDGLLKAVILHPDGVEEELVLHLRSEEGAP